MPINLNKIDPVIVNNVHQQTMEGIVHSSNKTKISKDKSDNREGKPSYKNMKDKLDKFNSLLGAINIDANFEMNEDHIVARSKDGNIIKTYTLDAVQHLFSTMEDMIGVFIDTKR